MFSKRLALFALGLTLAGCSAATTGPDDNSMSNCDGGKCDAFAPPALQTLDTTFGECTVTPDLETQDEFFARDKADCAFVGFDESIAARLDMVMIDTVQLSTNRYSSTRFDKEELDGTPKTTATWTTDGYPIRMTFRPVVQVQTSSGRASEPESRGEYLLPEIDMEIAERPTEQLAQAFELPLKFQQIAIWPTQELADRWAEGDFNFSLIRFKSEVEVGEITKKFSSTRYVRGAEDLTALSKTILSVPVAESAPGSIEVFLDSDEPSGIASIDGPGYFLLEADGSLTAATPEEVEQRGMFDRDADAPTTDENPDGTEPDEPPVDPVDPIEPADDPCEGACDATEACVGTTCVPLEDQRQTSCQSTPTAACESDVDCAADNVCADGLCRLRECQTQPERCYEPTKVCEQDTDCAEGHACAQNLCRRLSCQTQSERCYEPTRVCEQNTDCAAGHACVDNLCRILSCQTQSERCYEPTRPCAEDSHCADGHACVQNLCRILSCQTQSERCYEPTRPCETTSDCSEGHVCEEEICKRLTCID